MTQQAFGDLVVVIPGILGSRLVRKAGGRASTVWDFSLRHLPALLLTAVTQGIALEGNGIDAPDDDIEAADLFNYQLLPGYFGVDDYASLVQALQGSVGERQVMTFPYDWRLSNRHAAAALERRALDALTRWRAESGNGQAKLWLVCHSMGGLVARYFCECLSGAPFTRAIISIGTPHRGSVRALDALVNGKRIGGINLSRMVRSMPSTYELLPLFPVLRSVDGGTVTLKRIAEVFGLDSVTGIDLPGWVTPATGDPQPLPGIDRVMLKRALEFHAAIRSPAEARAGRGEPAAYEQYVFFNRRQPTALSAQLDGAALRLFDTTPRLRAGLRVEDEDRGDGTVPSFASLPIEWDDSRDAIAVAEKHAEMQAGQALQQTLFNRMRPLDVRGMKGAPPRDSDVLALEVPSVRMAGETVHVMTSALRPTQGFIDVVHIESGSRQTRPFTLAGDNRPTAWDFVGLGPGVHRVILRAADRTRPTVSDYVFVAVP